MKFLVIFLLLISSSSFVFTQEQNETSEEEKAKTQETIEKQIVPEIILTSSPHVITSHVFLDSVNKEFIIGERIRAVIGLSNNGDSPINVTQIAASLMYHSDWRYYIQNFTKQAESVIIRSGEESSFFL